MSVNGTSGALALTDVRSRMAAALAPVDEGDPPVLQPSDSVDPPALMLLYDDPWLTPLTMGCLYECRLEVRCVASRIEPAPGFDMLDALTVYALTRIGDDSYPWTLVTASAARVFRPADIPLLFTSFIYRVRVSL